MDSDCSHYDVESKEDVRGGHFVKRFLYGTYMCTLSSEGGWRRVAQMQEGNNDGFESPLLPRGTREKHPRQPISNQATNLYSLKHSLRSPNHVNEM